MALKVNNRQTENKASLKESVQKVSTRPVKQTNWYKGSKPTSRETLARIYAIGESEPEKRDQLMSMYQEEVANPTSPIYNPYTSATTTKQTQTNANNTLKAQDEWARLSDELSYWATRSDRNYSDEEIISRINWDNYKTLQKMDEGRKTGNPLALLDAVGYSEDAMYGVIWAARNPGKSAGTAEYDAVQSVLGRGNQYKRDDRITSKLDPTNAAYNPYVVGSTSPMDSLAYKYHTDRFDDKWLQDNRDLLLDPETANDYGKIYNAVQDTNALQAEADAFKAELARYADKGAQPDYDYLLQQPEYKNLAKLQESLDSGQLISTTSAIDFDLSTLQTETNTAVKRKQEQTAAASNIDAANALAEEEKQENWFKGLFKQGTTPKDSIEMPKPVADESPAEVVADAEQLAGPVVNAMAAEGDYAGAAEAAQADLAAMIGENPDLLTTDNTQKLAMLTLMYADQAGILTNPEAKETAKTIQDTVAASMSVDTESEEAKGLLAWMDDKLQMNGALVDAQENEGLGWWMALKIGAERTMTRGLGFIEDIVGGGIVLAGELLDNEAMINYGKETMEYNDRAIAHYDAILAEHGTPLEILAAQQGSEIAHMMQMGSLSKGVQAYNAIKFGGATNFLTRVLMGTPFAAEAGSSTFEDTYNETDNAITSLATGAAAFGVTTLLSQWDGILKNIEAAGMPYLPEVVKTLGTVPGSGFKAARARWGKAAGMWLMNGAKTIVNESAQEAAEGGATDIIVSLIKGENLSDMDWEAFGKDRMTDAVGSVFLTMGSVVSTMPSYARSVKVAESQMHKSDVTAQDVETLVTAVQEDLQDPEIAADALERAQNIAIESRTGELIASGAIDTTAVENTRAVVESAEKKLADAEAVLEKADADIRAANEKFKVDMTDEGAKNAVLAAVEARTKAVADVENAKVELQKARVELSKANAVVVTTAREQAKAEVLQAEQTLQQQRIEQEAAAEVKRQNDNVAALEANDFINETNPDVNDEEFGVVQQTYISTVGEDSAAAPAEQSPTPVDRKAVEFTTKLSKLFNVKFNFVESDDDFEGKYSNGVVTINKKATQGEAIRKVALHELIHHVEKTGEYKTLVNLVKDYFFKDEAGAYDMDAYDKEVEDLRQLYESKKDTLGIKENIDYAYGERELVAEYAARIFEADEQFIERIVAEKPSLAVRISEALKGIVDKLRGVNDPELDMIRKAEKAFRKALEKSADPRARSLQQEVATSEHPNAEQFSISQFARAAGLQMRTNSDGDPYTIVDADGNEVKNVTSDMIKASPMGKLIATAQDSGTIDADTAQKQYDMFAELMTMIAEYKDQAMIWEIAGSELFSAIKSNSDTQYSTTVDFGTICSKTREVVTVMSETMLKKGRGLTREEVIDAYNNTHKAGMAVPCPVCYVFSRWMGVPSLLETMRKGQERFANATDADVNAYLKSVSEKYGIEGKDLSESVGKAKTKVQNKLKKISESLLKDVFKNNADKTALIEQAKALEAELDEIEMFNWVNQVLCKTDSKRKPILDKNGNVTIDPSYKAVPNEVLLDLRRTGEFASEYAKAWTFRTTRGAGMGKAILPYSGAELGDTISGVKRWAASQNPYFTGDDKVAARKMKFAQIRAKAQNLIGGQRFQSTSDYRPEWGLDYLSTFLEMQAIGAKGQLYTKVIEAVDMFATAGIEVNMSIMPKNDGYHLDENGNPVLGEEDFSDVTGISFKGALEKTQKYDNAQMILVGINDTHIELAMADDRISFIIPWHSSGNSKDTLTTLMNAVGESLTNAEDYTDIQTDKPSENQTPEQKAMWDLRMEILTGKLKRGVSDEQQKLLDSNPYLKALYEKFYVDESATDTYGVKLSKAQAGQIFPHEYWDTNLTVDQADENGRRFVEYCATMGIEPRFGKFSDKPGYWKLLIDRRMYNRDGTYHVPQTIDVTKVDIADVASEVSQAKVGTPDQISKAVQGTIDDINARLPAEPFDMQADVDIDADNSDGQYSIPSDDVLKRQVRSWKNRQNENSIEIPVAPANSAPASIDEYDQRSYYRGGWARVNNVLSAFENRSFKSYVTKAHAGQEQFPTHETSDGLYVYETHTLDEKKRPTGNNVLIVTDMSYDNPSIDRVYRIGYRHEDVIDEVREQIYEFEQHFGQEAPLAVENTYEETVVKGYSPDSFQPYSEMQNRTDFGREGSVEREGGRYSSKGAGSGNRRSRSTGSSSESGEQYSVNANSVLTRSARISNPSRGLAVTDYGDGERQFAGQTIQNSAVVPDWVKQEFLRPEELNYETDTNREQVERAWQRIQQNGYEAERDRLLSLDRYSADDTAEANLMMAMALREDTADPATFMALASHYNKEGTKAGQELQARKLFSRMSPTGARVWVAGQMENRLEEHMRTHRPEQKRITDKANKVADTIRDLQSGDEVLRLNAGGDFTIDESNNRWGIPINQQQQALIDHYNLNNVARPGIFYNRATTQQRMLEAIIATPNPLEVTGLGLNLIQRLEYMAAGEAVITNADLNYIGTQLGQFVAQGGDEGGREADLAVSRAYEAYGNITPSTTREKLRTWRYVSMLLSVPSATRNVIGNAAQNAVNATAHGIAVELDKLASRVTGQRTVEHLSVQERIDGWRGFADETRNTFRDYFIDRSVTQRGNDKYNTNQRGRVYQNQFIETMRNVEGFLMSFGDRNMWRKAYLNSLAEQQKLADRGLLFNDDGTTRTHEQMLDQAEADANYATFTEDNAVSNALSQMKNIPGVGEVIDFIMPFTGVPTNITRRMIQYSLLGLVDVAIRHGYRFATHQNFDQRAFVDGVSRVLTGTALFGVGILAAMAGVIKPGTGDEDDDKKYGLKTAMGGQYTPYVYNPLNDEYVSLAAFAPAVSPLTMGLAAYEEFKNNDDALQALVSTCFSGPDQIFDASYMSGIQDIFKGYGSPAENITNTVFSNAVSQNVPALLTQLSNTIDPYVRDTKDKNAIMQALKSGLINRIPGLREQLLPEKVDVTGQPVRTKEGLRNFYDPFTTTDARKDPAVDELFRLSESLGSSSMLPSDALSGSKTTLTVNKQKVTLDGKGKEAYRKRYGELWLEGGVTIDKKGRPVVVEGVRKLMESSAYQMMDDDERADAIADILSEAKTGAAMEALNKYGAD